MIKYGSTRIVFLVGKYAIKIPSTVEFRLFLHGLLGNMQEKSFWTTKNPKLCPVLFCATGGWVLIMQRAVPFSREEFEKFDHDRFIHDENIVIPVENKMSSFGTIDGKTVAIDYGS